MQVRLPILLLTLLMISRLAWADEPQARPLPRAHSHNDYNQQRPLLDALDHGFCSVEADVFLIQGKLLVGHSLWELDERRTLQSHYLDPLRKRVEQNNGRVHSEGPLFMLLIDFKQDGAAVYAELRKVLTNYKDMLCRVEDGEVHMGAIQIVISGDCPRQQIEADNPRYAFIDGRVRDLGSDQPAHTMPLISDRWGAHFQWRGEGDFPADEREKLHHIVAQAHQKDRRVRFWATPENTTAWNELVAADVDHINTDKLPKLRDFLLDATSEQ